VEYVDYDRGLDACHVRLSTRAAAFAICKYFKENWLEHDTPRAENLSAFSPMSPMEEDIFAVSAAVLEGEREQIYWEKIRNKRVDLGRHHSGDRKSSRNANSSRYPRNCLDEKAHETKCSSNEPDIIWTKTSSKHIRFDEDDADSTIASKTEDIQLDSGILVKPKSSSGTDSEGERARPDKVRRLTSQESL